MVGNWRKTPEFLIRIVQMLMLKHLPQHLQCLQVDLEPVQHKTLEIYLLEEKLYQFMLTLIQHLAVTQVTCYQMLK